MRASDNPSLRGGGRVNVRIESAALEFRPKAETGDRCLDVVGERCADVGGDGDIRALVIAVAIVGGSRVGRLNKGTVSI